MLARLMNDFTPLLQLHHQINQRMNQLTERFFEDLPAARTYGAAYPGVNVWDDKENGYIEAELPGLTLQDVEVYVQGNQLSINGTRRIPEPQGHRWYRRERSEGNFSRTITLPWDVDADKIEAKLRDGVLIVRLPKTDRARPKTVKVLAD